MRLPHLTNHHLANKIEYYACWEDVDTLQKALKINNKDVVLTITSSGCNALNFLLYNPKKVIAVDYNKYQNYLLELKIEAIKNLDYLDFLSLMGVKESNEKEKHYSHIRKFLSEDARRYWDSNKYAIDTGLIYVGEQDVKFLGKFTRYFSGKNTIEKFFECETIKNQEEYFYRKIYDTPLNLLLKIVTNNYFIKISGVFWAIGQLSSGRDKTQSYFKYIQKSSFPKNYYEKIENILTKIPIKGNYFASLLLLNRYANEDYYPPYFRKESFLLLKDRIKRIQIQTCDLGSALASYSSDYITKFNLSNAFDWISDKEFNKQLKEVYRVGKNKARLCYLTTRCDRSLPKDIRGLKSEKKFALQLLEKDRTMLYSDLEIGEIDK